MNQGAVIEQKNNIIETERNWNNKAADGITVLKQKPRETDTGFLQNTQIKQKKPMQRSHHTLHGCQEPVLWKVPKILAKEMRFYQRGSRMIIMITVCNQSPTKGKTGIPSTCVPPFWCCSLYSFRNKKLLSRRTSNLSTKSFDISFSPYII